MDILNQIKWLSYKYLLLDLRSWKINVMRLLVPIIGAIVILIFVNSRFVETQVSQASSVSIGDIPKCNQNLLANGTCVSLIYNVDNSFDTSYVEIIMEKLCSLNPTPLTLGVDVIAWNSTLFGNNILNYLYDNANYTYGAISWSTASNSSNEYIYTVYYNATDSSVYNMFGQGKEFYLNNQLNNIETAIERAISAIYFDKNSTSFYNIEVTPFPEVSNEDGYSVSWDLSIVILYCVVTFNSLVVLVHLVAEKEEGMRGQMRFSGLLDISYWTCEIVNHLTIGTVSVGIMVCISWLIPGLQLFHECNLFVLLFIMLGYQFNATAVATLLYTFISLRKTANIFACVLFAAGLVVSLLFALSDSDIYDPFGSVLTSLIWSSIPWFSFTKALMDVKLMTVGPTYISTGNYYCLEYVGTGGNYFTFSDMFKIFLNLSPSDCEYYYNLPYIPNTFVSVMVLIVEGVIFYLIAFYLDKVLPTDKYRAAQSPFFFLKFSNATLSVNAEDALFIEHLSKTYRKNLFSANGTLAVKPFLMKTPNSSILCLLGPNGAGKTTTISCLTGLVKPTEGDAYIYGLSIISQMDEIRKNMGVCPQFDLLWSDLSAWEHLRILNGFKSSEKRMTDEELLERLSDVRLLDVKDLKSAAYSGGMKRRLSLLISTIGNPLVMFLDEPTTGMDPDNRQYVWKLIKKLKQNRLVILTTHSMEEADQLGDVVGIIAKGKLRCYGRPLELKSRFGLGFRVTLTTSLDQVENLKAYVQQILPGAQLRGENAGSLVYNLPDVDLDETIIRFFEKLEKNLIPGISDWGIQNTTLEDVYLSISRKVMGQDISFEGAAMFDRDERQMFKDSVSRYEDKLRLVQFEIDSLRKLLEDNGIDHSVVSPARAKKKFSFNTDDLAENRL